MFNIFEVTERGSKHKIAEAASIEAARVYVEAHFINHKIIAFDLDEENNAADAFLAPANSKVGFSVLLAIEVKA